MNALAPSQTVRWLWVLYDGHCATCRAAKDWLASEPQIVELRFVDAYSAEAIESKRWQAIPWRGNEVTVVADDGRVWAGTAGFLMSFWALRKYRSSAEFFLMPGLTWLAAGFFGLVSSQRHRLNAWNGQSCIDGECGVPAHKVTRYQRWHAPTWTALSLAGIVLTSYVVTQASLGAALAVAACPALTIVLVALYLGLRPDNERPNAGLVIVVSLLQTAASCMLALMALARLWNAPEYVAAGGLGALMSFWAMVYSFRLDHPKDAAFQ